MYNVLLSIAFEKTILIGKGLVDKTIFLKFVDTVVEPNF